MITDDPNTWPPFEGPDDYLAVLLGTPIELKVQASRFLAQVFPAETRAEAELPLRELRKRFHDAHHHCSAGRVGPPPQPTEWSDDDGEPSHTAGPPILQVLQREGVCDAVLVVTRWFGGVKLGSGGLIRAYGEAAEHALAATPRKTVPRDAEFSVTVGYEEIGAVEAILARAGSVVRDAERRFEAEAHFALRVQRSRALAIALDLREATRAKARFERAL